MITRVTHQTVQQSTLANLQVNLSKMADLQGRLSGGKNITKPSDDPAGTALTLQLRAEHRAATQAARNADDANSWLTVIDSALQTSVSTLRKARDLTVQGANTGAMGQTSRDAIAVEIDETTYDPAVWGQNFPAQYEASLQTREMGLSPTGHGGSRPVAGRADDIDPRETIASSRLEEDPRLVAMWDGYPFSKGYHHARGHVAERIHQQRRGGARPGKACGMLIVDQHRRRYVDHQDDRPLARCRAWLRCNGLQESDGQRDRGGDS